MGFMGIFIISIVMVALAFAGLAIKILVKKKGKFPNIHIGSNKHLKERGITCAQTYDKIEQAKVRKVMKFKELSLGDDQLHVSC